MTETQAAPRVPETVAMPGPPAACQEHGGKGRFVRDVLERIGDKWSLMIIGALYQGPMRFTALQHVIGGISQRMLTLNLRQLQRDGLVSRTVYAEVPPRVEYELTELGHSLLVPVLDLVNWAADHADQIEAQRIAYDATYATSTTNATAATTQASDTEA